MKAFLKRNSSTIFTVGAGAGVLTTAYLASVAGYRAAHRLESEDPYMDIRERAILVWRLYIPTAGAAAATIICLAGAKRVDASKILASQTALAVSQRAYEGYRAQVIEELGDKKDKLFRANVAEKEINKLPLPAIVVGQGKVMCCELYTGRFFESSMEALSRAVNDLNAGLVRHDYATLDEFYYLVHLGSTSASSKMGWKASRLVELEYSSILHGDTPCLAFDYNYLDII